MSIAIFLWKTGSDHIGVTNSLNLKSTPQWSIQVMFLSRFLFGPFQYLVLLAQFLALVMRYRASEERWVPPPAAADANGASEEALKWYREAELKHGRVAMAASVAAWIPSSAEGVVFLARHARGVGGPRLDARRGSASWNSHRSSVPPSAPLKNALLS